MGLNNDNNLESDDDSLSNMMLLDEENVQYDCDILVDAYIKNKKEKQN